MDEAIFKMLGHVPTVANFITAIKNIKRSTDSDGKESPAVKDAVQRFGKDVEPPFRRLLRRKLRAEKHSYQERLRLIENDPDWIWVTELYPSVYTRKKKLFFMSADKFVSRNDTIIDISNVVYESMIANHAIVFIDEFDSTKNQILSRLVEDSVRNPVDYLDMYQKIYQGGMHPEINPDIYKPFEELDTNLSDLHRAKMKRLNDVRKKYHLESPVVLDPDTVSSMTFLFKSDVMYVVNNEYDGMTITYDSKGKKNIVSMQKGKKNKEIFGMFKEIDYAIEDYCRLIRVLAYNYYKRRNDPTLSYEDSVYIILDLYGITDSMPSYRRYLHKRVMLGSKSPKKFVGADSSVYEKGFEYFGFQQDALSMERAQIRLVSCLVSAEKILLKVCERALVFGISATAEFKTVLGNYDLDYLKSRLEDEYLPSISYEKELAEQIKNAYGNYESKGIKWDIESIPAGINGEWDNDLWKNVIDDEKHLRVIEHSLNGVDEFHMKRYYQLAYAIKALISSEIKRNGVFFCNMHPVEKSPVFDSEVVRQLFSIITAESRKENPYIADVEPTFLKKDDFASTKKDVQKRMSEGHRAGIITSYGTFSTGQNVQFPIPKGFDALNVSRLDDREKMDVDMVYLQTPTHLIHAPETEDYAKDMVLHLCDIHYLKANGEVTLAECKRSVSSALSGNRYDINMTVKLANDTKSGHMYAAAKLTQAIGRICRTNMKNKEITIYYDEGVLRYIDQPLESYGLVSPETRHFYESCLKDRQSPPEIKRLEDLAVFRSYNANNIINGMLGWHDESTIANYKAIRHDLLCNPSMHELNNTAYQMYVELPEESDHYWCSYRGEYQDLKISFDRALINGVKIDTEGLRYGDLFTIPGLKKHFETMGYATELKKGRYLVSPVAAKNILLGIHGEVAGSFIIDPDGKLLKEMNPEDFEKFDFQLNGKYAVDFKHWRNDIFTMSKVQHGKIIKKMKETGHDIVYIANIFLPEGKSKETMVYEQDGKRIVKIPWLFDPKTGQFNDTMISEIREASYGSE